MAPSFTHGLICGFGIVIVHASVGESINSSPVWSAYVFPSSFGCAKRVIVPPRRGLCLLLRLGAAVDGLKSFFLG